MEAEIKKLTAAIAQMANKSNNIKNVNPNTSSGNRPSRRPQNMKSRNMGGTATPMATTPLVPTTLVQTAVGKRTTTRTKQCGPTPLVETHSGHLQGMSQSISKITPHGRANQLPPVDRDQGQYHIQRTIPIQLHFTKESNNYH
jgi:hypothetical protein